MDLNFSGLWLRLRTELRDALELVLLPGLAAVLPWRWCFLVFQQFARMGWLYRVPCETALLQARKRGWAGKDEAHWLWARRLVTLVDHADHYLGLWRRDVWMHKHLTIEGTWPTPNQSVLLLTFHWGAGFWGLRHAAANGLRPHALVASLDTQAFQGRTILSWYARSRTDHVKRILGSPTIDVVQDLKRLVLALREKHSLLGVMDVPADEAKASVAVEILDMPARVPRGLLRLAVDQQLPVVIYVTGLNAINGGRFLRIKNKGVYGSVQELAADAFAELGQVIAEDAPAWHFWGIADRLFTPMESTDRP